jgi:lipopolysaccharide export LptBFGC system permease protein LptF
MFLEYIKLLSIGAQPEFSYEYIFPLALILLSVVAIVFIGYKLKEEIGAIVAILISGLFFLYMNDLLRVFF